jgi:hypothetical protein
MQARAPRSLIAALLLAIVAAALPGTPSNAADQQCDLRILPRADALSVEAAARAVTGDKPQDVHVSEACIVGTTTHVALTTPRGRMRCERLQSTWAKRGGWKCDAPEPTPPQS